MSARRPNQRAGRFDEMPADEAKALLEALDSMSAPRKIWAYDDGLNSPDSRTWSATVPVGPAYHHDDVVLELVAALERVSENMAKMATGQTSLIDSTKRTADTAITAIREGRL